MSINDTTNMLSSDLVNFFTSDSANKSISDSVNILTTTDLSQHVHFWIKKIKKIDLADKFSNGADR